MNLLDLEVYNDKIITTGCIWRVDVGTLWRHGRSSFFSMENSGFLVDDVFYTFRRFPLIIRNRQVLFMGELFTEGSWLLSAHTIRLVHPDNMDGVSVHCMSNNMFDRHPTGFSMPDVPVKERDIDLVEFTKDSQNVHNSGWIRISSEAYGRLKNMANMSEGDITNRLNELSRAMRGDYSDLSSVSADTIRYHPMVHQAVRCFTYMQKTKAYHVHFGKESEVLARVWSYVKDDIGRLHSFIQNLAECENLESGEGMMFCLTGRLSRIVSTVLPDMSNNIPIEICRQEMLSRAATLSGESDQKIIETLRKEYVDSGILSEQSFSEEILAWDVFDI